MNTQVIHIFGASGSGTTSLGKYLSQELGFFHMDTDDYYWEESDPPYTCKRSVQKRLSIMRSEIANHNRVVLSGSLAGWGDDLIPLFTLAIRLETDTHIRLDRIRRRERQMLGPRIDAGGDMYAHHLEFLQWAASYDEGGPEMRSRLRHDLWQKKLNCNVLTLNGSVSFSENCKIIRQYLDWIENSC